MRTRHLRPMADPASSPRPYIVEAICRGQRPLEFTAERLSFSGRGVMCGLVPSRATIRRIRFSLYDPRTG
jgi:hypothetical protein